MPPNANIRIIKQAYDPSPEAVVADYDGVDYVWYDDNPFVPLGTKRALPAEYCHPEPGYNIGRCTMIKADGKRCPNPVREGWRVCRYHGAGGLANPGGGLPRHAKYLPSRLSERFQEFISDPDALALYSELALVDSHITELMEKLDSCESKQAWLKVEHAAGLLRKQYGLIDDIDKAYDLLIAAKKMPADEAAIWTEINKFTELRRRLSQTEQARIMAAKQYLTVAEANAMLASVMEIVIQNVADDMVRKIIADKLQDLAKD